jgi:hypothetical protein
VRNRVFGRGRELYAPVSDRGPRMSCMQSARNALSCHTELAARVSGSCRRDARVWARRPQFKAMQCMAVGAGKLSGADGAYEVRASWTQGDAGFVGSFALVLATALRRLKDTQEAMGLCAVRAALG